MSKIFRRMSWVAPATEEEDPHSAYLSLLDANRREEQQESDDFDYFTTANTAKTQRRRPSSQQRYKHKRARSNDSSKSWLSSVETPTSSSSSSWLGDRGRPFRKLVKEPGIGSARPSFSLELSEEDSDAERVVNPPSSGGGGGGGVVRRQLSKLKVMCRKGMKPTPGV
ncbi:hypothetical protein B0T26DRAFT_751250 [Lasiosphaeria miniovina]|uniref:Uncharacterized protein n=1 Tax=Lasiosphaeria miniovina TaxID=1954250 RepID=A0AA40DXD8_9PEZI|nr:uncharacterized protein B0T26DRAFT_751250 [Lasiosphaeria miniovina]KAK0717157.1 hypothetical protein B0T26DRAFT_751250 [Lasiosphaeria miniovina]